MTDYARRWCNGCQSMTSHRAEGAPVPSDPRFVSLMPLIRLIWVFVEPWTCDWCGAESWPWTRGRK